MSARDPFIQHALNGGEVSRRFEARQDQNKYLSSVSKAQNWVPLVLGGTIRRCGSVYVTPTKQLGAVLIRFVFNSEQAYMLEFGDLYVRFFKDGAPIMDGLVPLELVTPYPTAMLRHIKMSAYQSADVMYIPSDGTLPVYKLRRLDDDPDTFDLAAVNFKSPGTKVAEITGAEMDGSTLTPGAVSGDDVTFTASGAPFLAGDVGMTIKGPLGATAIINTFTNASSVIADIIDAFDSITAIPADEWTLSGTPSANINPSKAVKGGNVNVSADADVFRDAYDGMYILVYGGLIEITRVNGVRQVTGIIRSELIDRDKIDPSPTGFWSLEEDAWNDEDGYPTCGCFYQERNILARGQTRWASNSGDFENFAKGSDDSAGFARTISDDEINDIRWIKAGANGLFSATQTAIYRATASNEDGPLTPNDFNEKPVSDSGTAIIAPARIAGILLYVQNGQKKLIEQAFNFVDNKFDSPDLLQLADHLTEFNTIVATAYQQRPDSIVWCVRDDGKLLAMVYRRKEEVVGWAPQSTDGEIKDVATIPRPHTSRDWLWQIVEREIDGEIVSYVEFYEDFNDDICREWREAQTDSAIFTVAEAGVITGLEHLEGKIVRIIGDGLLFQDQTVTDGQVTVIPALAGARVTSFEVGLDYVSDGLTLEPVIPQERGGPLMARGWVVAGARIRRTLGLKLNDEPIPFRQASDAMDTQVPLKRGKVVIAVQKCDGEGRISFVQDVPFPAEILNIFGRVAISDEPFPFLVAEPPPPFVDDCVPPSEVEEPCIDTTPRGQQAITFVVHAINDAEGNERTSWGYVGADGEVWTAIGTGTCAGGNMVYETCVRYNHYDAEGSLDFSTPLISPNGIPAVNIRPGQADEPMMQVNLSSGGIAWVYPERELFVDIAQIPGFTDGQFWAKEGNDIYVATVDFRIEKYHALTGGARLAIFSGSTVIDGAFFGFSLSANFIWVFGSTLAGRMLLLKLNRSDGILDDTIDLGTVAIGLSPVGIYAVSNDLVYILSNYSTRGALYYYDGSNIVFVGEGAEPISGTNLQPPLGMRFIENNLYFGQRGASGFSTAIFRCEVGCPVGTVATVQADAATVAAGDSIDVSWAGVIAPDVTDKIQLRAEPSGSNHPSGQPGIFNVLATGEVSGTIAFAIPGATAPGNYVFLYYAKNQVFVCASEPFEVT